MSALGWAALGLAFAWMLLAAKAHGRQLRLERELVGLDFTDFRNPPPEVARLWKAERKRFWPLVGLSLLGYGLVLALADSFGVAANLASSTRVGGLLSAIGVAALVAMSVSFLVTGLLSLGRLRRAAVPQMDKLWATRGAWLNLALRGSAALWGVVVAVGLVVGALLFA